MRTQETTLNPSAEDHYDPMELVSIIMPDLSPEQLDEIEVSYYECLLQVADALEHLFED